MKTFDQLEDDDTPNIQKLLSTHERKLRSILLNKILQLNASVPLSEIMSQADDAAIDVFPTLVSLEEKGLIVLQDDGTVAGLYPFSAVPTRHKVQLIDGRSFFAMCAIDSLGIAYELEKDAVISSSCSQCTAEISIEIINGEILLFKPATSCALHVSLNDYKDWANTCGNYMNFFCTEKHLQEWLEGTNLNQDDIYCLSIEDAGVVGRSIFGKGHTLHIVIISDFQDAFRGKRYPLVNLSFAEQRSGIGLITGSQGLSIEFDNADSKVNRFAFFLEGGCFLSLDYLII